jgi:hypothetical protein
MLHYLQNVKIMKDMDHSKKKYFEKTDDGVFMFSNKADSPNF